MKITVRTLRSIVKRSIADLNEIAQTQKIAPFMGGRESEPGRDIKVSLSQQIQAQEAEIAGIESDLKDAMASGNSAKITQLHGELQLAQSELSSLTRMMESFHINEVFEPVTGVGQRTDSAKGSKGQQKRVAAFGRSRRTSDEDETDADADTDSEECEPGETYYEAGEDDAETWEAGCYPDAPGPNEYKQNETFLISSLDEIISGRLTDLLLEDEEYEARQRALRQAASEAGKTGDAAESGSAQMEIVFIDSESGIAELQPSVDSLSSFGCYPNCEDVPTLELEFDPDDPPSVGEGDEIRLSDLKDLFKDATTLGGNVTINSDAMITFFNDIEQFAVDNMSSEQRKEIGIETGEEDVSPDTLSVQRRELPSGYGYSSRWDRVDPIRILQPGWEVSVTQTRDIEPLKAISRMRKESIEGPDDIDGILSSVILSDGSTETSANLESYFVDYTDRRPGFILPWRDWPERARLTLSGSGKRGVMLRLVNGDEVSFALDAVTPIGVIENISAEGVTFSEPGTPGDFILPWASEQGSEMARQQGAEAQSRSQSRTFLEPLGPGQLREYFLKFLR